MSETGLSVNILDLKTDRAASSFQERGEGGHTLCVIVWKTSWVDANPKFNDDCTEGEIGNVFQVCVHAIVGLFSSWEGWKISSYIEILDLPRFLYLYYQFVK